MNGHIYTQPSARRILPVLLVALVTGGLAWILIRPHFAPTRGVPPLITLEGNTMGGTWSAKLRRLPPGQTQVDMQKLMQEILDHLNGMMSTWQGDSDLNRFNHGRGNDWVPVPQELADVVWSARRVSEETGGAFDVTVAPLVDLWGFGPEPRGLRKGETPTDDAIATARSHVDYRRLAVRLAPPALRKDDPDLRIDLSAIAKGYAAARLARALDARDVADYLIAVGGELRAKGRSNLDRPWHAGIEVPTPDTHRILRQIELRDSGVSTSGDYRNFVDIAAKRFSHEIDPHTGRPLATTLASVSVVHPDSAYADAMATALMVLGPADGYNLASRLHLAALFVTRGDTGFQERATPEFENFSVHAPGPTTAPHL